MFKWIEMPRKQVWNAWSVRLCIFYAATGPPVFCGTCPTLPWSGVGLTPYENVFILNPGTCRNRRVRKTGSGRQYRWNLGRERQDVGQLQQGLLRDRLYRHPPARYDHT